MRVGIYIVLRLVLISYQIDTSISMLLYWIYGIKVLIYLNQDFNIISHALGLSAANQVIPISYFSYFIRSPHTWFSIPNIRSL